MVKTPLGMYGVIVDTISPVELPGQIWSYAMDLGQLRRAFALHGFNTQKDAWREYILVWIDAGYAKKLPDCDVYYLTRAGLESTRYGRSMIRDLQELASTKHGQALA